MPSARLPCSAILSRLPVSSSIVSSSSARSSSSSAGQRGLGDLLQLVEQLDREAGEVVDEVQRVLDLVGDAGGELAERGHLLGLDQVGLRRLQALQRVAQLGEQPHVLDGDHGLGGEGLEQLDLLRREGAGLDLAQDHCADGSAFALQWCSDSGAEAVPCCEPAGSHELGRIERLDIRQVACPGIDDGAPTGGTPVERTAITGAVSQGPSWATGHHAVSVTQLDHRVSRATEAYGRLDDCSSTGCTSVRRTGDDLQDVGGGRLPLQRRLGGVACGADLRLGLPALGDVAVDQDEAAARQRRCCALRSPSRRRACARASTRDRVFSRAAGELRLRRSPSPNSPRSASRRR